MEWFSGLSDRGRVFVIGGVIALSALVFMILSQPSEEGESSPDRAPSASGIPSSAPAPIPTGSQGVPEFAEDAPETVNMALPAPLALSEGTISDTAGKAVHVVKIVSNPNLSATEMNELTDEFVVSGLQLVGLPQARGHGINKDPEFAPKQSELEQTPAESPSAFPSPQAPQAVTVVGIEAVSERSILFDVSADAVKYVVKLDKASQGGKWEISYLASPNCSALVPCPTMKWYQEDW